MRTNKPDCTVITDPLTSWRTPWLLIEQRAFEHREVIAFDERGTLLNAELPADHEIPDESLEWVECDPIRGGDPGFQAHARKLLEDAGKLPVECPNCGSDELQTVGYVGQHVRGTATATADGVEFEPGGYTDYGDDYRDTHIECSECMRTICELKADPFAVPPSEPDPPELRAMVDDFALSVTDGLSDVENHGERISLARLVARRLSVYADGQEAHAS